MRVSSNPLFLHDGFELKIKSAYPGRSCVLMLVQLHSGSLWNTQPWSLSGAVTKLRHRGAQQRNNTS